MTADAFERPNPSRIQNWACPMCGRSDHRWGRVRRRIGWRLRWVHVDCWAPSLTPGPASGVASHAGIGTAQATRGTGPGAPPHLPAASPARCRPGAGVARCAAFVDVVSGQACTVHLPPCGVGISHPGCGYRAEVSPELDAFFCRHCQYNGRISGAWFLDLLGEA